MRWLWTSENTVDQHQQMTCQPKSSLTVETSHWTSRNIDSVPLHSSSRLWDLDFQMKCKMYFQLKEDFGPLSNSPVIFLLSPGKMLLTMFLFQKWLGSPFLKISERGDSWCTDSSFSSLLVNLSQVFEQYSQAYGHPCCLFTFFYPISSFQSTLHLICFDTAIVEQPPLSIMTLCDLPSLWRVLMIIFWTIAKSAVFPIIVVSKNKWYPQCIL